MTIGEFRITGRCSFMPCSSLLDWVRQQDHIIHLYCSKVEGALCILCSFHLPDWYKHWLIFIPSIIDVQAAKWTKLSILQWPKL